MARLVFCAVALLALSACNTVQGVGRDITSAGAAVQRAVN